MTKNFHYVTRANYEAVLKQELEKNGIAVIEGNSKTGKSELVNAYCHAHTTDYQQRIIWLHANSQAQLLAGCNQVLEEMLTTKAITIDMEGRNSREKEWGGSGMLVDQQKILDAIVKNDINAVKQLINKENVNECII